MSKEIILNQGYTATVDDEDFESVSRFKWCVLNHKRRRYAYCTMQAGRIGGKRLQCHMLLHRLIMRPPEGIDVDHKDHDGLNCQRDNMRLATRSQNLQNQRRRRGSSLFKGVNWNKSRGRWLAQICVEGRRIFLGRFSSEIDAACAYDTAARKYFGEFACLNFPREKVA